MKLAVLWILLFSVLVAAYSCKKDVVGIKEERSGNIAPENFNFVTSKTVDLNLRLLSPNNKPVKGALVSVLIPSSSAKDGVLFKAVSDMNGYVKGAFSVPAYLDTIQIEPNYPGLMSKAKSLLNAGTITATIGGEKGYSGNIVPEASGTKRSGQGIRVLYNDVYSGLNFFYPAPYTGSADGTHDNGIPNFLDLSPDNIDPSLLSFISVSLPNGQNVGVHHSQYIYGNAPDAIDIIAESDVSITFVSEGADYKNSLGYYTYPTNNPPSGVSPAEVGNITLVFPNASAAGSGGGLHPGDKVKIGHFSAGTSIGFILLQDAWKNTDVDFNKNSSEGVNKFFSNTGLNPENASDPDYSSVAGFVPKKHSVMIYDNIHQVFLFGFEDTHRSNPYINVGGNSSDNDFNDLLFYATPEAAFDHTDVPLIDGGSGTDTDGDGVPDVTDEFPNDPERAYTQTSYYNTIAFEDLWPSTGDYDLNDLVVKYRYKYVKNAANNVVELYCEYIPLAAGAQFKNGFGVEFPFAPSIVQNVTGQLVSTSGQSQYISLAPNGLEAGQTKAVIIPFDNHDKVLVNANPSDIHVNTNMDFPKVNGTEVTVLVSFITPVSYATIGDPSGFNPFIVRANQRGYEVHLPGKTPTSLAGMWFFGTYNDATNASLGIYYKTADQWPWAINIAGNFTYPVEGSSISSTYLHFLDWAQSGGTLFPDWYFSTNSGYRDTGKLYTK
jgi:LruC domain-containing protein